MNPELSIIIVNWNSKDYVGVCLQSLYRLCRGTSFEVIVVDGASFDGCAEMLAKEFPLANFIQSPENIGFGRCNNLGARHSLGRFLLFLNPDTELLEDSIAVLMERFRTLPNAGAVGCKLLNQDRSLQMSCVQSFPTVLNQVVDSHFLRTLFPKWSGWGMQVFHQANDQPMAVEVVAGACILTSREVFETVGGFTEDYFMFGEDLDLCFKIRQLGKAVYCAPETSIVHLGGGSTRKYSGNFAQVTMRESVHRFFELRRGPVAAACYRAAMTTNAAVRLVLALPCLLIPGSRLVRHGTGSLRKWLSIFRWGLRLEMAPSANPLPQS